MKSLLTCKHFRSSAPELPERNDGEAFICDRSASKCRALVLELAAFASHGEAAFVVLTSLQPCKGGCNGAFARRHRLDAISTG